MNRAWGFIGVVLISLVITALYLYFVASFCIISIPWQSGYALIDQSLGRCLGTTHAFGDWQWMLERLLMSPAELADDRWRRRFDPHWLLLMKIGGALFVLLFGGGIYALEQWSKRARNSTVHGKFGSTSLHGEARWATQREIRRSNLLDQSAGGVVIGGYKGKQLVDRSGLHVLCFAPTGSGKGIGIVTPTMLRWTESVICLDIKRELYHQTAGYRASQGQRILPFDPTNEYSVRFNPLAEMRVGTKYAISDCQRLANVFVNPGAIKGDNRYFANEAYTWVSVLFLHVVYKARIEDSPVPSLRDVYLFMNGGEEVEQPVDEQDSPFNRLCQGMIDYDHGDDSVNDAVRSRARQMKEMHDKTRSSVISSANEPFNLLFMDPMVIRNTSSSDFTIHELMNGEQPSSLYLMFPPSDIERLGSLFRVLIELFLSQTLSDLDFVDGQAQSRNRHKLLLLMDEFTSIGKLEIYEKGLAYMRGYGVKSMIIIQNMGQLDKQDMYTKENAFMANADVLSTYYSNHPDTQQMISKMCGKTTVVQEKVTVSGKGWDKSKSTSMHEVSRDLLQPDDVGKLKKTARNDKGRMEVGENIVFVGGLPPIFDRMYPYFNDKRLAAQTKIPPPELRLKEGFCG